MLLHEGGHHLGTLLFICQFVPVVRVLWKSQTFSQPLCHLGDGETSWAEQDVVGEKRHYNEPGPLVDGIETRRRILHRLGERQTEEHCSDDDQIEENDGADCYKTEDHHPHTEGNMDTRSRDEAVALTVSPGRHQVGHLRLGEDPFVFLGRRSQFLVQLGTALVTEFLWSDHVWSLVGVKSYAVVELPQDKVEDEEVDYEHHGY